MATLPSTSFNPDQQPAASASTQPARQDADGAPTSNDIADGLTSPPPYSAQEVSTGLQATSQVDQRPSATATNSNPQSSHNASSANNAQDDLQLIAQTPSTKEIPSVQLEVQQESTNAAVSGPAPRPESLIVNGIKYVPEVIPVVVNAPAPSSSEPKSLRRVGNLPASTAGQLPQPGLGTTHGQFGPTTVPESSTAPINASASTNANTLETVTDHQAYIANA
jgi:hypothetical protein